jgi:C-terminal processing protease CtpA/Prc
VKDVRFEYLGQGVGYLRLTIFDMGLVREARTALESLKKAGMKGLILDLRHNPGGALPAATGVADLFLPQGLTITNTVSHYKPSIGGLRLPGFGGNEDYVTKVRSEFESMPMVCLVNRASASASELLAGALKDHRRALLIGETTYGKGVGQTPILLSSMLMKRYLYLTVMRYTTPHGTEVDHKGVAPDLVFGDGRPPADTFSAEWSLRRTGEIEKYRDAHWGAGLRKLADTDGFETGRYEGFGEFFGGLRTALTKDQVREEIRRSVRRRMEDEGKVWMSDLQTDQVLQRGLVEILDRIGK